MASKRKSKIKKGRSPSMAAQVKSLMERVAKLEADMDKNDDVDEKMEVRVAHLESVVLVDKTDDDGQQEANPQ
jgi:hypothetical protein